MQRSFSFLKDGGWLTITLAVLVSVFFVMTGVNAATTINANVNTGGTLTVSGHSSLTTSSSTITSQTGNWLVNGYATTTAASGNIATEGTFNAKGNVTLGDAVTDSVTATAYFTQMRIGTDSTFDDIGAVGADELGVEGAMEVDGAAYFDGAIDFDGTVNIDGATTHTSTLSVASATSTLATTTVARLLTVGTTTPWQERAELIVDSAGTSTLWLASSRDNGGSCFQLENALGVPVRAYVTSANAWSVAAGFCK